MSLSHASELPSELLELIVQELDPEYATTADSGLNFVRSLRPLVAFSLVCRRWHATAFSRIFRRMFLFPHVESVLRDLSLFLTTNHRVAATIQVLSLYANHIHVQSLYDLIDSNLLPNLRYLVCDEVQEYFISPPIRIGQPMNMQTTSTGIRTLDGLKINGESLGGLSATGIHNTALLLGRFSLITSLDLTGWSQVESLTLIGMDGSTESGGTAMHMPAPCPRIEELNVNSGPGYAVALFREIGVPSCLTCLSACSIGLSSLMILNELLSMVGATLGHLRLEFRWRWDFTPSPAAGVITRFHVLSRLYTVAPARDQIVHTFKLERGLAACTGLHGLQLELAVASRYEMHHTERIERQMIEQSLLTAIELTSLIPRVAVDAHPRLKYIEYEIQTWTTSENALGAAVWRRLREECRRIGGLKSIRVTMFSEQTREEHEAFGGQLHAEMYECVEAVRCGESSRHICEEEQCRWSRKGRGREGFVNLDR